MSHTPLDSSQLAELKYAFFSRTGRKTKKLRRSNLFPFTIFKHGLLEGSTQFSVSIQLSKPYTIRKLSIRRAKMCNFSRIGRKTEKQTPSKVQKLTLRNKRTWSPYCEEVWTGSDRFGLVRTGVKYYFPQR